MQSIFWVLRFCLAILFFTFLAMLDTICARPFQDTQSLSDDSWSSLQSHPRLFASASRFDELKQQIDRDDISREIFTIVRETAIQLLDKPTVEYVDKGAYWHGPMRQAQGRILSLAMMFRLTGEARFLERAKLEMKALAELPHWYPRHFLDTAEGALGMAIGIFFSPFKLHFTTLERRAFGNHDD